MPIKSFIERLGDLVTKPLRHLPEKPVRRLGVVPTILASVFARQTSRLYDFIGTQPGLGRFLNVGWWEQPESVDPFTSAFDMTDRCARLVRKVGSLAGLNESTRLLDVGFGYGEQDRIFLEEFDCGEIVGVNITTKQVRSARDEFADHSKSDRLQYHVGDAVELPYNDDSFNGLIALESPFHFHTRENFLREAHRVLEPGGRFVATDIVNGHPPGEAPFLQELCGIVHDTYWQVDSDNHTQPSTYEETLREIGFKNVRVNDVSERTLIPGITHYMRWRTHQQPFWLRYPMWPFVKGAVKFYESEYLRYVTVEAHA